MPPSTYVLYYRSPPEKTKVGTDNDDDDDDVDDSYSRISHSVLYFIRIYTKSRIVYGQMIRDENSLMHFIFYFPAGVK